MLKYVPSCELKNSSCSKWDITGWNQTELGKINTSYPFSGKLQCYCVYILFNYCGSLWNCGHEYCII
jgi:hypothetical protein